MAEYVIRNNEDVFSVINKTVGDLNNIYSFLLENTEVLLSEVPVGITVNYTRAIFQPPAVNSNSPNQPITLQSYKSRRGQTIYDICLMTITDLNSLYTLNFNNIITPPKTGTLFNFNPTKITDKILSKYVRDNNIIFTSSVGPESSVVTGSFILRSDGGYLLRQDGGKFIRN